MPIEYEYRYYNYNKEYLLKKIIELGGEKVFDKKLCKNYNFLDKSNKKMTHRIRTFDDTNFIYSQKIKVNKFEKENELIINSNIENIRKIFENIGLRQIRYVEKFREKWKINDIEIVFDSYPGCPEYCEIEAKTFDDLIKYEENLNMKKYRFNGGMNKLLFQEFGIKKFNFKNNVSFSKIDQLEKKVTKNLEKFKLIVENYQSYKK